MKWDTELVYHRKEDYFADLLRDVRQARHSIELETYIFEFDQLGHLVFDELAAAAARGVRVRLIVDGVGSLFSLSALGAAGEAVRLEIKVYHPLYLWRVFHERRLRLELLHFTLSRANKRLHRKFILIDNGLAYAGGYNIIDAADRDSGVRVTGNVQSLAAAFEKLWSKSRWRRRHPPSSESPLVLLNYTRALRRQRNAHLVEQLHNAREHIWITNAYFVPPLFLLNALQQAGRRGVDVRLLISKKADHIFMNWIMRTYYLSLLRHGIRVFEYQARFLHAKTLVVDDSATVGSTNLNHRSLIHDLEVDIVLTASSSKEALRRQFETDLQGSVEIFEKNVRGVFLFTWVFDQALRLFRFWV